ncbi:MAG: DNA translocase FtsK 4TM domain-containing protein, partial [Burkholderiales bacterium]|nr:DNA translocase FtsK 4TM domain-containing protein [Burkholderiales bacterium]
MAGALSTYNTLDLGFSRASTELEIHNICGSFGAWTSDLLYLLFGWGAWLFLAGLIILAIQGWKALKVSSEESQSNGLRLVSFCILTLSLCTLLFLRFYSYRAGLPGTSGGVIGSAIGTELLYWAGLTGSTIICLVLIFLTAPSVFSFSWLSFVEGIGATLELMVKRLIATKQKYDDNQEGKEQKRKRQRLLEDLDALEVEKKGMPRPKPFIPEETEPVSPWKENNEPILPTQTEVKLAKFKSEPQDLPIPEESPLEEFHQPDVKERIDPDPQGYKPYEPVHEIEPMDEVEQSEAVFDNAEKVHDFDDVNEIQEVQEIEETEVAPIPEDDAPVPEEYHLPDAHLLRQPPYNRPQMENEELQMTASRIEKTLESYRIRVKVLSWMPGPIITMYKIQPAPGTPSSKIVGVAKDLARGLGESSIRVIENMREMDCIGLEVPNPNATMQTIFLKEILGSETFKQSKSRLTLALGKSISGEPYIIDLAKAPHLLVAGTTGSGKSVGINSMILSMLYKNTPEELRLILVDPKVVEFGLYEDIPHLITPVITEMDQAANALEWAVREMDKRYKQMKAAGVRKFEDYNEKIEQATAAGQPIYDPRTLNTDEPKVLEKFCYIVIIIDELADLLSTHKKQVEGLIVRLAQKARAAGIHLILATQRPSTDVVTP